MIIVHIHFNNSENPRKWFHGYEPGDPLQRVYTYDPVQPEVLDKDEWVCEQAFRLFNSPEHFYGREGEIVERYRDMRLRSLSVGDVVEVVRDGISRLYACADMGFKEI